MARIPMVTRTLTSTKANVLVVDVESGTTHVEEVTVPRKYKDDKKLLKAIRDLHENDNVKIVAVKSSEEINKLYGMSEDVFMENAKVLPPRTEE